MWSVDVMHSLDIRGDSPVPVRHVGILCDIDSMDLLGAPSRPVRVNLTSLDQACVPVLKIVPL